MLHTAALVFVGAIALTTLDITGNFIVFQFEKLSLLLLVFQLFLKSTDFLEIRLIFGQLVAHLSLESDYSFVHFLALGLVLSLSGLFVSQLFPQSIHLTFVVCLSQPRVILGLALDGGKTGMLFDIIEVETSLERGVSWNGFGDCG